MIAYVPPIKGLELCNLHQLGLILDLLRKEGEERQSRLIVDPQSKPRIATEVVRFPHESLHLLQLLDQQGEDMGFLYPEPLPVHQDPQFQKPDDVKKSTFMTPLIMARGWWRDFNAAHGIHMDAPTTIPAGALQYFSYENDVYGAIQETWYRDDSPTERVNQLVTDGADHLPPGTPEGVADQNPGAAAPGGQVPGGAADHQSA